MSRLQGLWLREEVTVRVAGPSVCNVRIDTLWREMNRVIAFYKNIFHFLEHSCLPNSNSEFGLFSLHYIVLPRINASLEQWNFHGICTVGYQSPMGLWNAGIMQNMDQKLMVLILNQVFQRLMMTTVLLLFLRI